MVLTKDMAGLLIYPRRPAPSSLAMLSMILMLVLWWLSGTAAELPSAAVLVFAWLNYHRPCMRRFGGVVAEVCYAC